MEISYKKMCFVHCRVDFVIFCREMRSENEHI